MKCNFSIFSSAFAKGIAAENSIKLSQEIHKIKLLNGWFHVAKIVSFPSFSALCVVVFLLIYCLVDAHLWFVSYFVLFTIIARSETAVRPLLQIAKINSWYMPYLKMCMYNFRVNLKLHLFLRAHRARSIKKSYLQ